MRKFALCLCAVAFRGLQSTQAVCTLRQLCTHVERWPSILFAPIWLSHLHGVGILIIVFFALFQFVCSPFWDRRVNWLDCICCLSILLHLISFIYYNDSDFTLAPGAAAFDTILVVVNILVIICILALFFVSAAEAIFRRHATFKVASSVSKDLVDLQANLMSCRDKFCAEVESRAQKPMSDIHNDFRLSKSDFEHAAMATLKTTETGHTATPKLIESLFHVLKRISQDKHDSKDDAALGLKLQTVHCVTHFALPT
jgi:hypothetical protein